MLSLKNINLSYNNKNILSDVSLDFKHGEINVITGESGSGKSSIIKLINGIVPYFTKADVSGQIIYNEQDISSWNITKRSDVVSTVFQNPKNQFFAVDSFDEIAFALENKQIPRNQIFERIDYYSKLLGTQKLLHKDIFKLSGGERQMVAITGVVAMNGEVYIFDEPSSSLDLESIEELRNALIKLKQMGKIIIIAEHRLYFLKDLVDKLHIIENSKAYSFDKEQINKKCIEKYNLRTLEKIEKKDLKDKKYLLKSLNEKNKDRELLEMENYKFKYKKNEVFDMDFSLGKGINFIIGENGIGKSTFIRCLCGLNKNFKGKTYYNNQKLKRNYEYISLVMQDVNYQLFTESVLEEVSIVSDNESDKKQVLEILGLWDKRENHPQSLSGGEKQRLLIATAMLSKKPIIVFDEPTSGLCKKTMIRVIELLEKIEAMGKIVIVITHDYEFIKNCPGKVIEFIK